MIHYTEGVGSDNISVMYVFNLNIITDTQSYQDYIQTFITKVSQRRCVAIVVYNIESPEDEIFWPKHQVEQ